METLICWVMSLEERGLAAESRQALQAVRARDRGWAAATLRITANAAQSSAHRLLACVGTTSHAAPSLRRPLEYISP
jgi:hypothetical protein